MMRSWKEPEEGKDDAGLMREWKDPGEAKAAGGMMRSWKEPEPKQPVGMMRQWKPPSEASEGGGGIIRQWKQPSPLGHFKAGVHDKQPPQSPTPALGRGLRPQPGASITPGSRRPQPPKPMQVERPGLDPARRAAITRSKVYIRAVGFFYHLSITVLFTTFTELLLVFFQNHVGKVAAFLGMCAGIERAMQFFTSPFLGNLSDSIGRKPVLMASLTMHLFSLLLVTAAPRVEHVLMYYIINGGFNVTLTMCNAIVTDLAVKGGEGDLARQYGKLGMAVGFSLVLGPAVGPSLSKLDIRFPLYVALGALIISVGLCWCMTEPLDASTRPPFVWADANPVSRLRRAFQHRRFVLFAFPFACTQVSECVYQFIILYAMKRFNWSYILLGVYVAGTGVAVAFVQGNLKYVVPRYLSEKGCVVLGLMGHAVAMCIIGVSSAGWMMPLSVLFQMVSSLRNPGIMSVLSTNMPHQEQGVLQGSIQSIRVIAKAAGGPLFGLVLADAVSDEHVAKYGTWIMGAPFLVAGTFDLVGMVVAIILFDKCALDRPGPRKTHGDEVGDGSDESDDEDGSGEEDSGTEDDSDPEYDNRR